MHLVRRSLGILVIFSVVASLPIEAHTDVPPDDNFEERRLQVLEDIATRYDGASSDHSCFDIGASAIGLVAKLELGERGHDAGVTPSNASDDIAALADRAVQWAGECHSRCVWGEAGSPGTMHLLLGLAMIMHRYETELPVATLDRIREAARGWWRPHDTKRCTTDGENDGYESDIGPWLVNGNLSIVAGHLLAGEAMGYDSQVWKDGLDDLNQIYDTTVEHGGLEMNAPIYTAYQFAALVPLLELEHDEARRKARILLDYLFLVHAHLYLPGGGLGAPQSRDYGGGAFDSYPSSLHDVLRFYTGSEYFDPDPNIHVIGSAVDYQLPAAIRSIFLSKGDGYTFRAYTPAPVESRHGRGYDFGTEYPIAPWHAVMTPDAMFGLNHAFRYQAIHVSMGVYARTKPETFPILYQYEPYLPGDQTHTGGGLPTGSGDNDPDDFTRELYDFRRMVHDRTMISVWDPREAGKPPEVVRQAEDTRVHIPDYGEVGGKFRYQNTGGWYVGKAGDSYVAYHPLGVIQEGPDRRLSERGYGGTSENVHYYYLRLAGRSGGIVELATTDQFESIDDYISDLQNRHLEFHKDPTYAEFDALDKGSTDTTRVRLEFDPERHIVGNSERPLPDSLDHGLLDSPFVDHDRAANTLTVHRGCHPRLVYDLGGADVTQKPPAGPDCVSPPLETTVFSAIPYFGDFANYEPEHPDRWEVVRLGQDKRLLLKPFEYQSEEDRLGEVATVANRTYRDVRIQLDARTHTDLETETMADYAVVFGYQDHSNYYFMLTNSHDNYSELFVLEDGTRRQLGEAPRHLIPDEDWHNLEVVRDGENIEIVFDGETVISASDDTFGTGEVGVGALNNSVLFDDIRVRRLTDDVDTADRTNTDADTGFFEPSDGNSAGGCSCDSHGSGGLPTGWMVIAIVGVLIARSGGSTES